MYKLIQYFKNYVNPESIQVLVKIKSQIAQRLLYKLDFKYKGMKKDTFVDRYKKPDIVKDQKEFLKIINIRKLFLIGQNALGRSDLLIL